MSKAAAEKTIISRRFLRQESKTPALQDGIHVATRIGQPGFERCGSCGLLVLEGITPEGERVWLSAVCGDIHRCKRSE
jgi:hypothetical protein